MTTGFDELKLRGMESLDGIIEHIAIDLQHFALVGQAVPSDYPYLGFMQKVGLVDNGTARLTDFAVNLYHRMNNEGFYKEVSGP